MERTFAWLDQFRLLRVRYDKRADIHEAFLSLGCALICLAIVAPDVNNGLSEYPLARRLFRERPGFAKHSGVYRGLTFIAGFGVMIQTAVFSGDRT